MTTFNFSGITYTPSSDFIFSDVYYSYWVNLPVGYLGYHINLPVGYAGYYIKL